jgi:tryptophan synthase beta chain
MAENLRLPRIAPEHFWLKDTGHCDYLRMMDTEALEPARALAEVIKRAPYMGRDQIIVMNLRGRGTRIFS